MTRILNECSFLPPESIKKVEEKYNATYVFESCIKHRDGGWCNFPTAIFYTEVAHPEGSNYFALYYDQSTRLLMHPALMITNGISATEPFDAIQIGDEIIYSRNRHDYRSHGSFFVDGGRDYMRYGGEPFEEMKKVTLQVIKDRLEVVNG